jgi:hypothetical protein
MGFDFDTVTDYFVVLGIEDSVQLVIVVSVMESYP